VERIRRALFARRKLFVTQANEKGGVLGRPINLIIKDVESSIDKAAKLVDTILSEHPDVPALFGLSDSDMVRAAAKVAAAANRVFVTSGATSQSCPPRFRLICFSLASATTFRQPRQPVRFSKLNARSASIVYDDNYTYTRLLKITSREHSRRLAEKCVRSSNSTELTISVLSLIRSQAQTSSFSHGGAAGLTFGRKIASY
jgi:hypothetical protein